MLPPKTPLDIGRFCCFRGHGEGLPGQRSPRRHGALQLAEVEVKARSDQDQRPKRGRDDRQAALFSLHAEDLAALRGHLLANARSTGSSTAAQDRRARCGLADPDGWAPDGRRIERRVRLSRHPHRRTIGLVSG
jgi:hypothetical protein